MNQTDPNYKSFLSHVLLFGGISGIAIGIGYLVITIAYTLAGFPLPTDAITWVSYLNGNFHIWWLIIWLSIITNLLYLPYAYAMYELLKINHAGKMLISLVLFTLFVVLELSITWSKYPVLIDLVTKYEACTNNELKSNYLAAIETISSEFQTIITNFYMVFIPSLATIISCIALWRSKISNRFIVMMGLISGACNAIGSIAGFYLKPLSNLVVMGSFLALFWFAGVGIALLAQRKKLLL